MSEVRKYFKKFNAIDLMTIALFALLMRFVFYYIYRALYLVFPWNQMFFPILGSMVTTIVLVMINKGGTYLFHHIAMWLINLFLQGEDPIYAAGSIPGIIMAELILFVMWKFGSEITSYKSIIAALTVASLIGGYWNYWSLNYIFFIPYTFDKFLIVTALVLVVSNPVGLYIGKNLGTRLKAVVG